MGSLRRLYLNQNLIEILSPDLFTLQLTHLAIRCNHFTSLPHTLAKVLESLAYWDLDWLDHCEQSCYLTDPCKRLLLKLG